MQWSDIKFDPSRKTLWQFAMLWLVFFAGAAFWQEFVRGQTGPALIFAALAFTIGPLGAARPEYVRPIYVAWMVLAFPIGWTMSQLILALMFYGLFAPIGLLFRLLGRDPLDRARCPDANSYWTPKPAPADVKSYFKQF
jgi:hypothetical protein